MCSAIPVTGLGASAYKLGEDVSMCWENKVELAACPTGLDVTFDTEPPETMHERREYDTTYTLDASHLSSTFSGNVVVDHINIHSCLSNVGFCTPFIANTPGLATHTAAESGTANSDGKFTVTSTIKLSAAAYSYSVIAHGRIWVNSTSKAPCSRMDDVCKRYDVARQIRRVVLPPENEVTISDATKSAGTAIFAVSVAVLAGLAIACFATRKKPVMKLSQPVVVISMVLCGAVTCAGAWLLKDTSECGLHYWLFYLPLTALMGFQSAKLWRVHKIFNNSKMRRVQARLRDVFTKVLGLVAVQAFLTILRPVLVTVEAQKVWPDHDQVNFEMKCVVSAGEGVAQATDIAIGVWMAAIFCANLYFSYKTRNVVTMFNESYFVNVGLYTMALVVVVVLPVIAVIEANPSATYTLQMLGACVIALAVCGCLVGPKLWLLHKGVSVADVMKKTGTSQASQGQSNVSKVYSDIGQRRSSRTQMISAVEDSLELAVMSLTLSLVKTQQGLTVPAEELQKVAAQCEATANVLRSGGRKRPEEASEDSTAAAPTNGEIGAKVVDEV